MTKKRITININSQDYQYIKSFIQDNDTGTNICELTREIIKDGVEWMKDNEKDR